MRRCSVTYPIIRFLAGVGLVAFMIARTLAFLVADGALASQS